MCIYTYLHKTGFHMGINGTLVLKEGEILIKVP
jgi:hypothetical protein